MPYFNNDDYDIAITCYASYIYVSYNIYKLINKIVNMPCKNGRKSLL